MTTPAEGVVGRSSAERPTQQPRQVEHVVANRKASEIRPALNPAAGFSGRDSSNDRVSAVYDQVSAGHV